MALLRTKRLAGGILTSGGTRHRPHPFDTSQRSSAAEVVYTVPIGKRAIIRSFNATIPAADMGVQDNSAQLVGFLPGVVEFVIAYEWFRSINTVYWNGHAVMNEGEELWLITNPPASKVWYQASGAEMDT